MVIIIPLGGIGKRFSELGYSDPKPLIKALGKEIIFWLIDCLKIKNKDKIYIIYNKSLEYYNFENRINWKNNRINFLKLTKDTFGPAETVLNLTSIILEDNKTQPVFILDGDTFYNFDIISKVRNIMDSTIFYFKSQTKQPIYSYIKIKNKLVTDIAEKIIISSNANVGAYYFSNLSLLDKYLKKTIKNKSKKAFISDVYKQMIFDKLKVRAKHISKKQFECLGTPEQLKAFSLKKTPEKKRFCFDLDNTLVSYPTIQNDYNSVLPVERNVKLIRYLKKQGHYIIIYTARRMRTYNSNVKKVVGNIKKITVDQLRRFNVPYDELIFGKPYANFYIDDLSVSPFDNLNYKLGYYEDDAKTRAFNKISIGENFTIKKSKNISKIKNEIKYFKHLPERSKIFFPHFISAGKNWYKIDTIKGVTYSYLLINKLLQEKDIETLLFNLYKLHLSKQPPANSNLEKIMYSNYLLKTKRRLKFIPKHILKKNNIFIKDLLKKLKDYELSNSGSLSFIHGDTVFSNIIKDSSGKIKYIDPRAGILNKFSFFGDKFYDYAKVYQSLTGFDLIVNSKKDDDEFFHSRKEKFEKLFVKQYGHKQFENLKILTSSLYLSLIPFHNQKYLNEFVRKAKIILK